MSFPKCIKLVFTSIGDCGTKVETDLKNQISTRISTLLQTKYSTKISTVVQNFNRIKIVVNGKLVCPTGFDINQSITADVKMINNIGDQMKTEMIAELQNTIDAEIKKQIDQQKGFLAQDIELTDTTKITNEVNSIIERTISIEFIKNIVNDVLNQNDAELNIGTQGELISEKYCHFNQNIVLSLIADNIANSVSETIMNDSVMNDLKARIEYLLKQKSIGLEAFAGPLLAIIIIIGLIVLVGAKTALDPKKLIPMIVIGIGVYLGLAYWRKWFPFKKKTEPFTYKPNYNVVGKVIQGPKSTGPNYRYLGTRDTLQQCGDAATGDPLCLGFAYYSKDYPQKEFASQCYCAVDLGSGQIQDNVDSGWIIDRVPPFLQ